VDDRDQEGAADAAVLDLVSLCENPQDGYRFRFPGTWHANDGHVTAPCRVFDVEGPEVEPDTVLPLASSVLITVEDHRIDEVPALIDDGPAPSVSLRARGACGSPTRT
jgi:hypothetical protein